MGFKFTKQASKDITLLTLEKKQLLRECIEKLPEGDIRKLADHSTVYRLRAAGHSIVYEERLDRKFGRQLPSINRHELLEMNAIEFIVMKVIPRAITWMEEIEAVRVGRAECKNGEILNIEDVVWS